MNLYAILDLGYVRKSEIVSCTKSICESGVSMLQLRAKSKNPNEILTIAKIVSWKSYKQHCRGGAYEVLVVPFTDLIIV